jgi:hypothetical protein
MEFRGKKGRGVSRGKIVPPGKQIIPKQFVFWFVFFVVPF